jgi:tetratricopeptide (TPR) repeat protein
MAHVRIAELHERRREFAEALAARRTACDLLPDDAMLVADLGLTAARAGDLAGGDSLLALAQAGLPRLAILSYHRGEIAWQLRNSAVAREQYERFVALAPRRLEAELADATAKLEMLARMP